MKTANKQAVDDKDNEIRKLQNTINERDAALASWEKKHGETQLQISKTATQHESEIALWKQRLQRIQSDLVVAGSERDAVG